MRRLTLLAAAALAVALPNAALPAAAQAAPDPAEALKQQLRPEHGVRIDEVARVVSSRMSIRTRYHSGIQLGQGGPVAAYSDMEDASDGGSWGRKPSKPAQAAAVGTYVYTSGEAVHDVLPDGKSWVRAAYGSRYPNVALALASRQTINVFDPDVLKATLKGAKSGAVAGGRLYRGTTTYAALYKADRSFYGRLFGGAPSGATARIAISWRLWTDGQGLIRRLSTTETATSGRYRSTDTRYSEWGHHLIVGAPARAEVVDWKDRRRPDPAFPGGGIDPSAAHSWPNAG